MATKWLSSLFLLVSFSCIRAQTITAASCNASDVQAALNSVTTSTTTVNIPAGNCTWNAEVTFTVPSGNNTLSILGAGNLTTTGGGDATVIIDDYSGTSSLWQITTGASGSYFRFAGITLQGGNGAVKSNGMLAIGGTSQSLRVDHSHLNMSTYSPAVASVGIRFANWLYGVADHNIFDGSTGATSEGVNVWDDAYGGSSFGDGAWNDKSALGTANFLFVEDNTFNNGTYMDDCYAGGRMVVRHNTINNAAGQTHPTGGAGRIRGCRAFEVYENNYAGSNSSPIYNALWLSSGTGVVWGNSAPTGYENFITGQVMRASNSTYSQTAPPNGWGYCGTSQTGSASGWDQNSDSSGYACIDQIGRGLGDLLQNDFPTACDVTSGGCKSSTYTGTWPHQALEPIYEWLDTWNQVPGYANSIWSDSESQAQPNRDYYLYTTSFTGSSGTGSGSLANRPSTCTPMVAYWATDQNTLYQCSSTNQWSVYYTPYTYPHPLTSAAGTTGPASPTNLTVVVQ
jgi:hypothetical protein